MSKPPSQITVVVSIDVDAKKEIRVTYSWTDPLSGAHWDHSSAFVVSAHAPYYTLFALDYNSSQAGWTFLDATPKPGSTAPAYAIAPNKLSLTTFDDGSTTFKFNLGFFNTVENLEIVDDPQEGNVSSPKQTLPLERE